MKEQKQTYLSPETETLVVRFEGVICESTKTSAPAFSEQGSLKDATWGWD